MRTPFEPWQLAQLERLASYDQESVESAMNAIFESRPELFEQVVIGAVDQDQISNARAAQILSVSEEEVDQKLAFLRRRALKRCCVVVCDGSVAKLADGGLPVWEVVRVYRRLGSLERLQEAFFGVSQATLESALAYAEANVEEIDQQINRYEELVERKKAEYPFAR